MNLINQYDADPNQFLDRIITGDKTWIHHYDLESKQESMELLPKGSNPPLKTRTAISWEDYAYTFLGQRGSVINRLSS